MNIMAISSDMIDIGLSYYRFGSEDSTDVDILIDHPEAKGVESDKELIGLLGGKLSKIKDWNANIIKIEKGLVIASIPSKGSVDAVHNSLFDTYKLHQQKFPFPLVGRQNRNVLLAVVKCVKVLMFTFKTGAKKDYYKKELSPVLLTGSFQDYFDKIPGLDFSAPLLNTPERNLGLYKSLIFRIAQTISLIDGTEIYTKSHLKSLYQDTTPIIDRIPVENIGEIFRNYLNLLHQKITLMGIIQHSIDNVQWQNQIVNIRHEQPL